MSNSLVDPNLLFKYEVEIRKSTAKGKPLTAKHALPYFAALSGRKQFADVRVGHDKTGLRIEFSVGGKKKPSLYVSPFGGRSDGLRLWIDSRSSPDIRRATQYCSCFNFFPADEHGKPLAVQERIAMAKEPAPPVDCSLIKIDSKTSTGGYAVNAYIPSEAIHGFNPDEFPNVAIFYSVVDAELGIQTPTVGPEMRYTEDPSLWLRARLNA